MILVIFMGQMIKTRDPFHELLYNIYNILREENKKVTP